MDRIPECIAQAGAKLFWDVDPATLDPQKHEDFILGRVLSDGTLDMVQAVRAVVGDDGLRAFVKRAPHRLDRRSLRFFQVVLGLPRAEQGAECTQTSFRRSSDALFRPPLAPDAQSRPTGRDTLTTQTLEK
jgi:hypothetical protein